jgi:hypothetical protein
MSALPAEDFHRELVTPSAPAEAFDAIQRVGEWWHPLVSGSNAAIGDEFAVAAPGTEPRRLRVAQLVPGRRIVWRVLAGDPDHRGWAGTDLTFELEPLDDGTRVRFIHVGLLPGEDGYEESTLDWQVAIDTALRRRLRA